MTTGPSVLWEGPVFARSSLALANREIGARLVEAGVRAVFRRTSPEPRMPEGDPRWRALLPRVKDRPDGPFDVVVRHRWPPDFTRPGAGRLVLVQHWEFGSLPREWIRPLNEDVDELWVATTYVRECCLRSGVDPDRVKVLPLGVDVRRFHPGAPPRPLPTSKSFRFLFVGGTIRRKGIHQLLDAYGRVFSARDDVCLVVKDIGGDSFYRGQTAAAEIRAFQERDGGPEVLHLTEEIDDDAMPGLYTACHALVHPYLGEGFGLPIAEAMAAGLPVAVTGHGAALDFCDESCAFLVPAREVALAGRRVGSIETVTEPWVAAPDVDALARILRFLAGRPEEARRRAHRARERIRCGFTWDHAAARCRELLDGVLARPPRAPAPALPAGRTIQMRWGAAPFNWSGYARVSRLLLPALAEAGVEIQLQNYAMDRGFLDDLARRPAEAAFWEGLLARRVRRGTYVCFHPPAAWNGFRFLSGFRRQNPGFDAYAAFTMFETDRLPALWAEELAEADQVWVPSRFNLETFARAGVPAEKLRLLQPGLDPGPWRELPPPMEIPGRRGFVFVSVFQWTLRKGWDVLLDAWADAFVPGDDVCLVLRAYPGERKNPPLARRIADHWRARGLRPEDVAPVILLDRFIPDEEMPALYAAADAYVLPSRGEAWGVPYLEAMAAGLPVIGTRWGGQLDFMDDGNSYLIDTHGLEPVPPEQTAESPYYEAGHSWAAPSRRHCAELLRRVFERREEARERGARARATVLAEWGTDRTVRQFQAIAGELDLAARARVGGAGADAPERSAPPVLWQGPLRDPSGYADEGRHFVLGLDAAGASVFARPVMWNPRVAEIPADDASRLDRLSASIPFGDFVHVQHVFGGFFQPTPSALATIGRTMFETDRIPSEWAARCNLLDEVWVPSAFNRETFAASGVERGRLHVVPGALDARRFRERPEPLSVPGRRSFVFLSVFDWSLRKGWDLLLRAWARAFGPEDDVALVLKTSSSLGYKAKSLEARIDRFLEEATGRGRRAAAPVVLFHRDLSGDDLLRLYAAADAYVMPTRGEGWGRPFMEAMALGVPAIGTGWGGNTEFMTPENSWLLDSALEDVPPAAIKEAPLFAGHRWAAPSEDHLVDLLRRVRADGDEALRRAARARDEVLSRFDRPVVAQRILARLSRFGAAAVG